MPNKTADQFDFTPEEKKALLDEIINFFQNEREEKIGIIAANDILRFFLEQLGTRIYNKALDDAKVWFDKRFEDVEADFYSIYK